MNTRRITDEQILAFAAEELTGHEAETVRQHLETDEAAARRVELYRLAQRRTSSDDSVAAPTTLVERAKRIFRPATSPTLADWIDAAIAAVAQLAYDSRVQPAAVRFHDQSDRFQLTFETDDAEIDLKAERLPSADDGDATWRVIGQVVADEDAGVVDVAVLPAGATTPVAHAHSDERSLFTFDVAPGTYELRVRVGSVSLSLPDVRIA